MNNRNVLSGICSEGSKTQGRANRKGSTLHSLPHPSSPTLKVMTRQVAPLAGPPLTPRSLYKHKQILDPSGSTRRGVSCLTLRLARALHTSEKLMDGLLPCLSWMSGKGSYLPGFLKARFPGKPNAWPSPLLPSLKLGSGIIFALHLVSFFAQLWPHPS